MHSRTINRKLYVTILLSLRAHTLGGYIQQMQRVGVATDSGKATELMTGMGMHTSFSTIMDDGTRECANWQGKSNQMEGIYIFEVILRNLSSP